MIHQFSWLRWLRTQFAGSRPSQRRATRGRRAPVRDGRPAIVEQLESRVLLAAAITVVNVDSLAADADGDGVADPGDQIHYTVTVQNTGDASATNLTFEEIINDPNLTLVPGSINVSPLAINDTFSAVANTQLVVGNATALAGPKATVAGSVLANDTEFLSDSFTISAFDATSTLGGTVSMVTVGPDAGSFRYTPAAGASGTDTFTYTIRDDGLDGIAGNADDLTSIGTVSITISAQEVWYVDSSFAGVSTGTSTNPFKALSDVTGATGPDGTGDIIYLSTGTGNYAGGITLLNNQTLWGQNEALVVGGFTLQAAGTDPVIENGAGSGVTLGTGNTLKGFTIGNTTGADISGTAVGSLTISNLIANGTGGIISISTSGALDVTLDVATTTSSTSNGISLTGVTGNFTASSGAISGVNGTDVLISGGSATVSIASSITGNTAGSVEVTGRAGGAGTVTLSGALNITGGSGLNIHDNSGGTVVFSNASKVINTGASTAVNLVNNGGATINFTNGGLDVDTTSGTAFNATGGGTISVTGTGNTLFANGSGTALNVANTTIAGTGLTFERISAGTGAGTAGVGISLNTTGSLGGLSVTGTGTTDGSGGVIQNKTGADGSTTAGIGIYLNSTANVSLKNMQLHDFQNFAIRGTAVTNLVMDNVDVSGTNGTNAGVDEGSVIFGYTTAVDTTAGITGTATISNSTFGGGSVEDTFVIRNGSGTLNRVTFNNVSFASLNPIGDALKMETANAAVINATVTNSVFTSAAGDLFQFNSIGTASNDLIFTGNTLTNNNPAIATGGGGVTIGGGDNGGSLTFFIDNNTFRDSDGHAILIAKSTGAGTFSGTFSNNTIGVAGIANSGSRAGSGIKIQNAGLGTVTVLVTGNDIFQYNNFGIELITGGGAVAQSGTMNATITGNTISNPGTGGLPMNGIHLNAGTVPGDTYLVRLDIGGAGALANTITGSGANGGTDIRLRQRQSTTVELRGYTGANNDNTAVQNYLLGRNTAAPGSALASNTVGSGGGGFVNTAGPGGPVPQPLVLAPVPLETVTPPESDLTETPPTVIDETVITDTVIDETPTLIVDDGVLSQEELDSLVAAAIARWEATGLTPEQIAILHSVTFSVADLPGWYLGEASSGQVIVDCNAAGNSWFIDATPLDDSEFFGTGTQLIATTNGGAAGRVDALTVIMHELGHQLGLSDSYSDVDFDDVMYGRLHQNERRLPELNQAYGADPGANVGEGPDFLFGAMNIGTLPAGYSVTIVYDATVDTITNGVAPTVSSQVRVQGDGGINVLSDDPSIVGTTNPTTTAIDGITLGNLVWGDTDENGTLNGAETGINGVTVNLYVDVNTNGVLDVGDGAAIASTVTAGGGLYSFSVLPGQYLVELPASNFQAGGPLENMISTGGAAIDPDNDVDNDDNGVNNASPAVNGISSQAITLNYDTEPTDDGTGQFDVNNSLDFGFQLANIPPVLAVAGNLSYTENDPATAIASGITVTDADQATLASATVTITNFVAGQDVLGFVANAGTMGNIAIVTNASGVLTLTSAGATATTAQWQAALRAVTYENTSNTPDTTQRQVDFVSNDGEDASNTLTSTIDVTATNDLPVLAVPGNISYTENDPATVIASGITVTDADQATLASATVTITNFVAGQDVLGFVANAGTMGNIAIVTNASGVLTLASAGATATTAQWQAALRAVTYENTSNTPDTTQRQVDFVVNDGTDPSNALTSTIDITATNDLPVLAVPGNISYTENDPATVIASGITVTDADQATLASATVTITNFVAGQDVLGFVANAGTMGNIAIVTNASGVLTLASAGATATTAQWQAALRAVTYENTSNTPDTTQRQVDFTVNDGTDPSNTLTSTIDITATNDVPVLANIELDPLPYAPNDPAVLITATLELTDADSSITSATVAITGGFQAGDVLAFTDTANITGVFNAANGVLTLTGADTVANYQAALRAVTYASTSLNPTARTVNFQVSDGTDPSNVAQRAIGGFVQLDGTTVNVYGTPLVDVITVTDSGALTIVVNGVQTQFEGVTVTAIVIQAGDGNDTVHINSLASGTALQVYGGNGNDTLRVDSTVTESVLLDGGDHFDLLIGGGGNDTLVGGDGNDWLNGGEGDDSLTGNAGNDVYAFDAAAANQTDTVVEQGAAGTDALHFGSMATAVSVNLTSDALLATMTNRTVQTGSAGQAANFENVFGGSAGDAVTGNAANNQVYGNGGNDSLAGGDGNDMLDGGGDNDLLTGGNHNDILIGGNGNDLLRGNAGNDQLRGGEGTDTATGGSGDDVYLFSTAIVNQFDYVVELGDDDGIDTLDFSAMTTQVTVDLTSDTSLASMARRIVRTGAAGQAANFENVRGGSGNDLITGNGANNLLAGDGGNDTLAGGDGNDLLLGGSGSDILKGVGGRDLLIGGTGPDLLQGGADDDLLIAGTTTYEADPEILQVLLAEWTSGSVYSARVGHLLGTLAGGLNNGFILSAASVTSNADVDFLTGGGGQDWFLADSTIDGLTDRAIDEVFTHIDTWI